MWEYSTVAYLFKARTVNLTETAVTRERLRKHAIVRQWLRRIAIAGYMLACRLRSTIVISVAHKIMGKDIDVCDDGILIQMLIFRHYLSTCVLYKNDVSETGLCRRSELLPENGDRVQSPKRRF
jgi:hypothetical protein